MHGGKTPRGSALPQTRHGRYSRDLPTRLLARYEESISDPELLNLSAEIAIVDISLSEMLPKFLDSPESYLDRITTLVDTRRKLVDTEQKRRVAMQNMITAEQGGLMVATLLDSVKRNVSDPRALEAIAADVARHLGRDAD